MGECRDCAYSDRPIYKWPCDVCRDTKNGRSMYCPEEADHIANDEIKTDYISREAVLTQLCNRHCATDPAECLFKITHNGDPGCFTADHILKIPAADVRPVKRGEWEEIAIIPDAYDIFGVITWASEMRCQKCGFTTYAIEGRFLQYNFCPNCGADMRGADG